MDPKNLDDILKQEQGDKNKESDITVSPTPEPPVASVEEIEAQAQKSDLDTDQRLKEVRSQIADQTFHDETGEFISPLDSQESGEHGSELVPFIPTPDNPIEEVRIGLQNTLGQVEYPTRVVMQLKNGQIAEMPWEKAEAILPPEYRAARELGERARFLQRQANIVMTAIRMGTDVMQQSGHVKDALLKPLRITRPSLPYLNTIGDLTDEVSEIGQESFLELRRMTNIRQSRGQEIQALVERLDDCSRKIEIACADVFQKIPKVKEIYERSSQDSKRVGSSALNDNDPERPRIE